MPIVREYRLDGKGRVVLPREVRGLLGTHLAVLLEPTRLRLVPADRWDGEGSGQVVTWEQAHGRLMIPRFFRDALGLASGVAVVLVLSRTEAALVRKEVWLAGEGARTVQLGLPLRAGLGVSSAQAAETAREVAALRAEADRLRRVLDLVRIHHPVCSCPGCVAVRHEVNCL